MVGSDGTDRLAFLFHVAVDQADRETSLNYSAPQQSFVKRPKLERSRSDVSASSGEEVWYSRTEPQVGSVSPHDSLRQTRSTPFPRRLFDMIEAETAIGSRILSWSVDGTAFFVNDETVFVNETLPKYNFRASKLASFQRNLNIYGFQRIVKGPMAGAYLHPLFHRDMDVESLGKILRRDPSFKNRSTTASSTALRREDSASSVDRCEHASETGSSSPIGADLRPGSVKKLQPPRIPSSSQVMKSTEPVGSGEAPSEPAHALLSLLGPNASGAAELQQQRPWPQTHKPPTLQPPQLLQPPSVLQAPLPPPPQQEPQLHSAGLRVAPAAATSATTTVALPRSLPVKRALEGHELPPAPLQPSNNTPRTVSIEVLGDVVPRKSSSISLEAIHHEKNAGHSEQLPPEVSPKTVLLMSGAN